jgi:hypothetical protein
MGRIVTFREQNSNVAVLAYLYIYIYIYIILRPILLALKIRYSKPSIYIRFEKTLIILKEEYLVLNYIKNFRPNKYNMNLFHCYFTVQV